MSRNTKDIVIICLSAAVLFIPFLGLVHLFDWDEINFAECAREMLVTGDWSTVTINFQPFWEKPPLFIWMQATSMYVFGVNEFAVRLPNAICGIITLVMLFKIGRSLYDRKFGFLWALVYAGSLLPQFYFRSGIIDPWFNLFIFLGLHQFILHCNDPGGQGKRIYFAGIFAGLAILTKGPVAIVVLFLCVLAYFIPFRRKEVPGTSSWMKLIATVVIAGSIWFLMLLVSGNGHVIGEFVDYQLRLFETEEAGHGGPFYYHAMVLLIGCFPASIFFIHGLRNKTGTPFQLIYRRWMIVLFWVVLILFSIVKTKIVHYSSLAYFPVTFLAAYSIYHIMNGQFAWKKWIGYATFLLGLIPGILFILGPLIDLFKDSLISSLMIRDPFAAENLRASVVWSGFEWIPGTLFILLLGWILLRVHFGKFTLIPTLFLVTLITFTAVMILIIPKVEGYTQHSAIEYYKTLRYKNAYVFTYGFKSYAHLYYSDMHSPGKTELTRSAIDTLTGLPGYAIGATYLEIHAVCKIGREKDLEKAYPFLKKTKCENGYCFFSFESQKLINSFKDSSNLETGK